MKFLAAGMVLEHLAAICCDAAGKKTTKHLFKFKFVG